MAVGRLPYELEYLPAELAIDYSERGMMPYSF